MPLAHRVLLASLHYPPEPTGNAPYAGGLAEGLARRGFQVEANVGHPHYPEWMIRPGYGQWTSFASVNGVSVRRRRHYVPNPPRGIKRLLSEVSFGLRLLLGKLDTSGVTVALSPSLFATAILAVRLRLRPKAKPLVVWVQDLYTLGLSETGQGSGLVSAITRRVESATLRSADLVVVIHERFARYAQTALGVDPSRTAVIRNWTHISDVPSLEAVDARLALGWPASTPAVVHTGNMGTKQDLAVVVESARLADARGDDIQFVLVGDGADRSRLEKLATGIRSIRILPPLPDDSYPLALAAADVLLVNEKEGVSGMAVPSKLTSYFGAGRPVLAATDPEGITASEISSAGAGIVVPAGDPAALLDAAIQMTRDREQASRFGRQGKSFQSTILSEEHALSEWVRVIQSVSDRSKREDAR